jgi:PhzF family phenazine biosynthesis protein
MYQVDAFADELFKGNPAAVVVLDEWLPNELMQNIAMENNLSETAFIVPRGEHYDITWFTPMSEIDLCGHATLASAHVIFNHLGHKSDIIRLKTRKVGDLSVTREGDMLYLNFPSRPPEKIDSVPECVIEGLGIAPLETYVSRDYVLVYPNSKTIRAINPDYKILGQCEKFVAITAKASPEDGCDFVSRFFCAGDGIEEDPVTGSMHCNLIPYWAEQLGKTEMIGKQLSPRGGTLMCTLQGDRVRIGGKALTYLEGRIRV